MEEVVYENWMHKLNERLTDPFYTGNTDHPRCPRCRHKMNFTGHDEDGAFPEGEGYWECPNCGYSITGTLG